MLDTRVAIVIAFLAAGTMASAGCASLLGLDSGAADDGEGGADVVLVDAPVPAPDASKGDSADFPDANAAMSDHADDSTSFDASAADHAAIDPGDVAQEAVDASDAARAPDATAPAPESGTCACPPVQNGVPTCTANGACGYTCDTGYADCAGQPCSCGGSNRCLSDDTCGACRASLQPCELGTDCCSGTCGAGLTCL